MIVFSPKKAPLAAGLGAVMLITAACGSSGPSAASGGGGAQAWALTGGSQSTFQLSQKNWNAGNSKDKVSYQFYANDAYKQKVRVAIGANDAPVLFENWGAAASRTTRTQASASH